MSYNAQLDRVQLQVCPICGGELLAALAHATSSAPQLEVWCYGGKDDGCTFALEGRVPAADATALVDYLK